MENKESNFMLKVFYFYLQKTKTSKTDTFLVMSRDARVVTAVLPYCDVIIWYIVDFVPLVHFRFLKLSFIMFINVHVCHNVEDCMSNSSFS